MVQQWKDVDEDRRAVHTDFQPTVHEAEHGAELVVFVVEALTQGEGADDIRHSVADQRGRVHAGAATLLVQSQQLRLDCSQALLDARLQAQLPQSKVSECGVAEASLFPPQLSIRCKDYS